MIMAAMKTWSYKSDLRLFKAFSSKNLLVTSFDIVHLSHKADISGYGDFPIINGTLCINDQ